MDITLLPFVLNCAFHQLSTQPRRQHSFQQGSIISTHEKVNIMVDNELGI